MNTDKTKYGVSKEDIRNAALGDFDDFEPVNEPQTDKPANDPVIPTSPVQPPVQVEPEKDVTTISVEDFPADMVFCTMCGRQLPATAKFCTGCGNQMSAPADIQQDVYTDVYSDNNQSNPYQQPVYNDIYSNDVQNDPFQPVDDVYGQDAAYPQNDIYNQDNQYQDYQYQDPYNQQAYQQNPGYAQGAPYQQNVYVQQNGPARPLKTDRNGIVALLLSFVTFGIYGLIFNAGVSDDVDRLCERFDGKKNINFWLMYFVISPLTCGIGYIVWMHCLCDRINRNLKDRGIAYDFGTSTFWLWNVLGSFIFVGPFIFMDKLGKAMNLLSEDYNIKG